MANGNEHSAKYELVRKYYKKGLWSEERVRMAVEKGWITQEECDEILYSNDDSPIEDADGGF